MADPVEVRMAAGRARDLVFKLVIDGAAPVTAEVGVPEKADDGEPAPGLHVDLLDPRGPSAESSQRPFAQVARFPVGADGAHVRTRVVAERCLPDGEFRFDIRLRRDSGAASSEAVVPVHVRVTPGGDCGRAYLLASLAGAVPLLAGLWWAAALRSSRFLPLKTLIEGLQPQVYAAGEGTETKEGGDYLIRLALQRHLDPWRRLGCWFRAWWRSGLSLIPRGAYEETLLLWLGARNDQLRARLLPAVRATEELRARPAAAARSVVLTAGPAGSVRVAAVPDPKGLMGDAGDLEPAEEGRATRFEAGRWIEVPGALRLAPIPPVQKRNRRRPRPGEPAGWRIHLR